MKCFDCDHINESDSNFCTQCGKSFKKKNGPRKKQGHNKNRLTFPEASVLSKIIDIDKSNSSKNMNLVFSSLGLMVFFFICFLVSDTNGIKELLIMLSMFFLVLPIVLFRTYKRRQHQYSEAISSFNRGHFCYNCGGKNIWRSTIYKTNITEAKCSRCKTFLWNE